MDRAQIEAHLLLHGWGAMRDDRWDNAPTRELYELHGPWRCYCVGNTGKYVTPAIPLGNGWWHRAEMADIPDALFAELAELALGDPP